MGIYEFLTYRRFIREDGSKNVQNMATIDGTCSISEKWGKFKLFALSSSNNFPKYNHPKLLSLVYHYQIPYFSGYQGDVPYSS